MEASVCLCDTEGDTNIALSEQAARTGKILQLSSLLPG